MAGIGFRLRGESYFADLGIYVYSALCIAGPWMVTSTLIFLLTYFRPGPIDYYDGLFFRTAITYCFCFSLIFTGLFYMSLSRHLADVLYAKDDVCVLPAFNGALLMTVAMTLLFGSIFFMASNGDPLMRGLIALIFISLSFVWVLTIFLFSMSDYFVVFMAYLIGSMTAFLLARYLGQEYALWGYFAGFLCGTVSILLILSARVFLEFESPLAIGRSLRDLTKYWKIGVAGLAYSGAIWIDKIVFWFSPRATDITEFFRAFPIYEIAAFLAIIGVIPGMAAFLLYVEGDFYENYREYYRNAVEAGTYQMLLDSKDDLTRALKRMIEVVASIQGILSIHVVVFAFDIINLLDLPAQCVPILRVTTLGAYLHTLILGTITVAMYFDLQRMVFWTTVTFFLTNFAFTWITVYLPDEYLGYGYAASAFVTCVVGFAMLHVNMRRLEYYAYALQPIPFKQT